MQWKLHDGYRLQLKYSRPVLRARDVYPGSEFFHPGSRVKKIPDPGSQTRIHIKKIEVFVTHTIVSKLSAIWSGMSSRIPILIFYPFWISGPGTRDLKGTVSGSATLLFTMASIGISVLYVSSSISAGEKPFSCSVCGLHFSNASNLLKHGRKHTGIPLVKSLANSFPLAFLFTGTSVLVNFSVH